MWGCWMNIIFFTGRISTHAPGRMERVPRSGGASDSPASPGGCAQPLQPRGARAVDRRATFLSQVRMECREGRLRAAQVTFPQPGTRRQLYAPLPRLAHARPWATVLVLFAADLLAIFGAGMASLWFWRLVHPSAALSNFVGPWYSLVIFVLTYAA